MVAVAFTGPAAAETGRLVRFGPVAPVAHPAGVHAMFQHWTYVPGGPLVCRFEGRAGTRYQVFAGFIEEYWNRPGQRIVDIEAAGKIVATVDTFNGAKARPHCRLFTAPTDSRGGLTVRIRPNPASPDKNPVVCGLLLFPARPDIDAAAVIANRGPTPLVEVLAGRAEADFYAGRGRYFAKKEYQKKPLPKLEETRSRLPSPVFDENPAYVEMYWKAWELAFRNFHEPQPGSGFVSQFIDAAFNQNIFLWDTCFMTMFCNYAHPYVPGIASLDNFYCKQFDDGEICREIDRTTGRDYHEWVNLTGEPLFSRWGVLVGGRKTPFQVTYVGREPPELPPCLTLDALNHPILAWAELESYRMTADRQRLALVYPALVRYYRALQLHLRQGSGLYMTDWASMDDSPRNPHLVRGGTGVDISSQMVLFARNLAEIAEVIDRDRDVAGYLSEAQELARLINERMWAPDRRFYSDLTVDGAPAPVKTVAAYWTLLAGVAGPEQVAALAAELRNDKTFGRMHRVPTVPGDEPAFNRAGGYWNGAVWEPVNTMVIRGLEQCGESALAAEIAREHLRVVGEVFRKTHTVWENYAPDAPEPGRPAKPDFVGWSGLGPILYLMEYGIGIRADAPANTLTWMIRSPRRVGVERFWFNGRTISLVCEEADASGERSVRVEATKPFRLKIVCGEISREAQIAAGKPLQIRLGPHSASRPQE